MQQFQSLLLKIQAGTHHVEQCDGIVPAVFDPHAAGDGIERAEHAVAQNNTQAAVSIAQRDFQRLNIVAGFGIGGGKPFEGGLAV